MTSEQYLSDLWRDLAGLPVLPVEPRTPDELRRAVDASEFEALVRLAGYDDSETEPYLVLLRAAEWSWVTGKSLDDFFAGMRARRVQGAFRYGERSWSTERRTTANLRAWTVARLTRWHQERDLEMLLDAANGLLFIWMRKRAGLS